MAGLRLLRARLLLLLVARRKRLSVARQVWLRLTFALHEARLAGEGLAVVAFVLVGVVAARLRAGVLLRLLIVIGVLLAELFLRGGDQAEIMFGVLVVILGGHRIAGTLRVARELDVFFSNVVGGAADLHVGPVRFIDPRQRILALAVTAASPHAFLTVSHGLPVR